MLAQLPGGEFGTLISGSGLSNPHVNWQAAVVRCINRGRSGAIVDKRQPSRVAMSEHVHPRSCFFSRDFPNEFQSVLPDHPAMLRIFVRNRSGCAQRERNFLRSIFPFGDIF